MEWIRHRIHDENYITPERLDAAMERLLEEITNS